jgi:rfaE bifunctional protein kinase chain/domain
MKIAVIGDIMIDRYIYGTSNRISPEAPVPVVLEKEIKDVLGGAGNVYNNLKGLGVDVLLCGVVGDFEDLGDLLPIKNGLIEKGITTYKKRIIVNEQQILRIDKEEKHNLDDSDIDEIINSVNEFNPDAIIISDYNKGVVTKKLIHKVKQFDCLKIGDPKVNIDIFAGFDTITPNEKEWKNHNGKMTTDAVLLTLGSKGMILYEDDEHEMEYEIKTTAKSVYDVTGAGDTVIATYTYFRILRYSRYAAANFANIAAGIVVGKAGTSFIRLEDMNEYINPFNNVKVVDKVWGNEIWFANSNLYCGKILNLKQGYQCSMHCHKEKDETFYILDGKVRMIINDETIIMQKGDSVKLKPNDYHSFGGILPSVILEVSTQHFDEDSYRLNNSGKWDDYENYIH